MIVSFDGENFFLPNFFGIGFWGSVCGRFVFESGGFNICVYIISKKSGQNCVHPCYTGARGYYSV